MSVMMGSWRTANQFYTAKIQKKTETAKNTFGFFRIYLYLCGEYTHSDMKKLVIYVVVVACAILISAAKPIQDCKCKNRNNKEIPLHGRVKVVSGLADFQVQVVSGLADLRVKKVNSFPDKCGEWQFVDSHADFTIEFVDGLADFTIEYVSSHSGQ